MAKNILIFSDGTGQAGGSKPDQHLSNIYKLYRATRVGPDNSVNPDNQLAFYDAGLGTSENDDPFWVRPFTAARKLMASATGSGISRNITDCYEAILERYEPGDRIYLFGFSRGGYTVRCLANVIRLCGIPSSGANNSPLPRKGPALREIAEEAVNNVYDHATGWNAKAYESEREILAARFRNKYSSNGAEGSNAFPYFIGVFDAVASIGLKPIVQGIIWFISLLSILAVAWGFGHLASNVFSIPWWVGASLIGILMIGSAVLKLSRRYIKTFLSDDGKRNRHFALPRFSTKDDDSYLDPRVAYARHALAIDERRKAFPRAKWGGNYSPDGMLDGIERFVQLWFAGNHSDIGGSYPEDESRLSDIPLQWMVDEALSLPNPIFVDKTKLQLFPRESGMQHCEVDSRAMSHSPSKPTWLRFEWRVDIRWSASGAPHHESVASRFALPKVQILSQTREYRPAALIFHRGMAEQCQQANSDWLPNNFDETWAALRTKWANEDAEPGGPISSA